MLWWQKSLWEWYLFLFPLLLENSLSRRPVTSHSLWSKEQQVKSQLDLGVEPGGKGNMDLTSKHRWNHFPASSPGPSSAGSQLFPLLRVFLASVWVATHFPLQVKAWGSWLNVLRNIHWRPRRVCCKPHKNLFVFWKKMPQKMTKDHKQRHLKWY